MHISIQLLPFCTVIQSAEMGRPEPEVEMSKSLILILNPAHYIDTHLLICHVTFSSIGIFINLLIMLSILLSTRLRQSHPNLLWPGVCFSNIFHLTVRLLEVLTMYFPDSSTLIRYLFLGWPIFPI